MAASSSVLGNCSVDSFVRLLEQMLTGEPLAQVILVSSDFLS